MKSVSKLLKKLGSLTGKAIEDYSLIDDNDNILIAVSGGKDSLTLLTVLKYLQKRAPIKFNLIATYIKTELTKNKKIIKTLTDIFQKMEIEYRISETKVLDENNKTNCFWCSWNKRKVLFELADELGCNKIALGHHKDDIVETILMNMIYKGEISTMNPRQEMFRARLTIIRPLCYVEEEMIEDFSKEQDFPKNLHKCPYAKDTKRKYIKDLIAKTAKQVPTTNIKTNIFNSLARIKEDYIDLKQDNADSSIL